MIAIAEAFRSLRFGKVVALNAVDGSSVKADLLGFGPSSYIDFRKSGPLRMETFGSGIARHSSPIVLYDLGDSHLTAQSGSPTTVVVLPHHRMRPGYPIPSALTFAFAQQWARHGLLCTHGSLIQVQGQGILILGARGAGKSIVSASALAAGGAIVSDDHLLLGDDGHRIAGERIRHFLALRSSWAADHLAAASGIEWTPSNRGRKKIVRIDPDNPGERFPVFCAIDRIFFLVRPRAGRQEVSVVREVPQATAYASFVTAVSPLLLGKHFPVEAKLLRALIMKMIATIPCAELETGQDIVLAPEKAWGRLLKR